MFNFGYAPLLLAMFLIGESFAVCPNIPTVPDLNLQMFLGHWHVHGIVNPTIPGVSCLLNDLSGEDFSEEPVNLNAHLMGNNAEGVLFEKDVAIAVQFLLAPGFWSWTEDNVQSTAFVIYTDYVEYALILICRDDGENLEAHFMSLFHDPMPDSVVRGFKQELENHGIDVSNYLEVEHGHDCVH